MGSQQTHQSGEEGQTGPETLQTIKAGEHQEQGEAFEKVRSKEVVAGEREKGTGNRLNSSQTRKMGEGYEIKPHTHYSHCVWSPSNTVSCGSPPPGH